MIEMLQQDFIIAGRARGLPERRLTYRHALRNTFIPILTMIGLQFAILPRRRRASPRRPSPGRGWAATSVDRIELRDYTAVQAVITVFAMFVALISRSWMWSTRS